MWVGRAATVVLLLGSFFYGLMMEEITQWLIFALWLMMAGIWLPNILQVVWWRFNSWGYLSSWIANLGISWLVVWVLPAFGILPKLPDYLQFWMLMALGAAIFIPATLLTKPEKMDQLVRFYMMTRPLGWWGPVRQEAARRGLIDEKSTDASEPEGRPLIRRSWTAEQAGEWTREDWIVIVLSPLVFAFILFGLTKLLLLQVSGLWLVLAAIAGAAAIYWVIDPKLRAVSLEFETTQAKYLEELERSVRWDDASSTEEG